MRTGRAFAAALLGLIATTASIRAQDYPSQTIRLIVPFLAGGPVDALARVVAQHLQNRVGQNVIVENRSGGGTTIGAKAVSAATPDGYTLLVIGPNIAYYPVLFPDLDFDPTKGLTRVATLVTWSHVIAVAPSVPANNIPQLVSYAKANPGKLAFGFGLATMPHIVGETFKRATGIDIIDVPYRGGEQARADLLGGRVHINIAPVPQLLQLVRDGKIRAVGYTGPRRSPDLPDIPTMTESGYPQVGFNPDVWMGILAPSGTPAAIVDKLNGEVNSVLKSEEMAPALKRFGYEAKITTPAEFETFFAAELLKWPPILKATGLKPQ
ncbi:MAG: tripartite tricarboxylate transporter substrate-binding protein [Alphaproteobacteria bacterium]|nr:tripartite tricarboxylate transporter substrate-binding protein [Alphaproteobacteria bacterium]